MKKYLCLFILLILTSCTTLSPAVNSISQIEVSEISAEIGKVTEDLKNAASLNEYDKLKEVFLPTFKNNIIVKNTRIRSFRIDICFFRCECRIKK